MKERTFAAIDIGSNAVRLLIKRYNGEDDNLRKQLLFRVPIRLGFDVFTKGKVSSKKAEHLLRLMKAYRQVMKIYEVDEFRACATSAMRDSSNGKEIIKEIKKETGIKIDIIAGDEEARIVYETHVECWNEAGGNFMYVDVGGGSTEINVISEGELIRSMSFNIGTVRTLTDTVKPEEWERLTQELQPLAQEYNNIVIVGSGGNINKLYKLAKTKDDNKHSFTVEALRSLYKKLQPLSVEQRMEQFGLKADRADVIIPASEIFLNIAKLAGAKKITVPMIGVSDGIIDGLFRNFKDKQNEEQQATEV